MNIVFNDNILNYNFQYELKSMLRLNLVSTILTSNVQSFTIIIVSSMRLIFELMRLLTSSGLIPKIDWISVEGQRRILGFRPIHY